MSKLIIKPHQSRAVEDILHHENGLLNNSRSMYVSACATGKSMSSLWAMEKYLCNHLLKEKKVGIFFFPSLALISQSYEVYKTQTSIRGYSPLVVCSETKIGQTAEDPEETPDDSIIYETCTSIDNVINYLSDESIFTKIIFVTYHSSSIVGKALLLLGIEADIGIFDEAHRTAQHGNTGNMSYALFDENVPICKRLFMTATPKHISAMDGDESTEFSMDNENVYGRVAHELPMRQAINEGLIADYTIIAGAMESSEEIDDDNAVSVIAEAFIRGIKKTGAKTAIAFQKNIGTSKAFAEWVATHYPDIQIRHIDGSMKHAERESVMRFLKHGRGIRIVTNARLLSEGIDAPAVDMIGLLTNISSEIDIVQRVGRVQRLLVGFPNKVGYVFIPIITNSQKEILYGEENLLNIITNLRENDEQLRVTSSSMKKNIPIRSISLDEVDTNSKWDKGEWFLPKLFKTINIVMMGGKIDQYFLSWEEGFRQAGEYYDKHGNIPKASTALMDEEKYRVGSWVHYQRVRYKKGLLSSERIILLKERFNDDFFADYEEQWTATLLEVAEEIEKTGKKPNKNTKLGSWVRTQRKKNSAGCLPEHQKNKLIEQFGTSFFIDNMDEYYEKQWGCGFKAVRAFFEENGKIPSTGVEDRDGYNVGLWCKTQRDYYKKGKLSKDKVVLLKKIFGKTFFDPDKALFLSKTREMMKHIKHHGFYPTRKENLPLYNWRARIVKLNRLEKIEGKQIKILHRVFGELFFKHSC